VFEDLSSPFFEKRVIKCLEDAESGQEAIVPVDLVYDSNLIERHTAESFKRAGFCEVRLSEYGS